MAKGVLFDFWGTLIEQGTYSPLIQSYRLLRINLEFSPFVVQFEETVMKTKFEDQAEGFKAVCEAFGVEPKPHIIDQMIGIWNKNKLLAKPYPETLAVLKSLKDKGLKLAIISNSIHGAIETVIDKYELAQYFDHIFISCETGKLKQEPGSFDAVIKELGLKKNEVIMVGDAMQTDIAGAEAAGITAVLVDRRDKREYKNKVRSLNELEQFL